MAYERRKVAFYSVVMLTLSFCVMTAKDDTDAQVDSNTLESIVRRPGDLENAQIDVGSRPLFIFVEPQYSRNHIYIANFDSNTVSVIDTLMNNVIETIPVGNGPIFLSGDDDIHDIYVANSKSNTVSIIDPDTLTVKENVSVGTSPVYIYIYPYSHDIYVANNESNTVSIIDPDTLTVKKNITALIEPGSINGDPGNEKIYMSGPQRVSVIDPNSYDVEENITMKGRPGYFYTEESDDVYVANSRSGSVSVIDKTTNDVKKIIPTGRVPKYIFQDTRSGDVYVANSGSDTVSVIDPNTYDVKVNVTVGNSPVYIAEDPFNYDIYVANSGSDTISKIDQETHTVRENIKVGDKPSFLYVDHYSGDVYVANSGSDGISVISGITNKVMARITFDVSPFRTGDIICDTSKGKLKAPFNRPFFVSSGTECVAKPSNGFNFVSWAEILDGNSTRTVSASNTTASPWSTFLDIFNVNSSDPAATLTVDRFGNFTAYFRALPPPVPAEYWASLFTVVATALVGSLLIPAVIGWTKSKRQTSRLKSFHEQMAPVYEDKKLDEKDLPTLNSVNKDISDSYAAGKINNEQYTNLKKEVSTAYQEIFKNRIETIPEQDLVTLTNIRNEMIDAYNKGKLSNDQYVHLKNEVSIAYEEIFKKRIENREDDLQRVQKDISNAYSKDKITKIHYDLLNEKISKTTQEKD